MLYSLGFGLLSASSLMIGALIGVFFNPRKKLIAAVMAFGSGALLSAVAFELVQESYKMSAEWPLIFGMIIGGSVFLAGNSIINNMGGFARNYSTRRRFVRKQKQEFVSHVIDHLSKVDILLSLPPEEVHHIVPFIEQYTYQPGQHIFDQGTVGDALYMIDSGQVEITVSQPAGLHTKIISLGHGQTFGEMALLTDETRSATAVASVETKVFRIKKHDFQRLLTRSPKLSAAVSKLLAKRLTNTTVQQSASEQEAMHWKTVALKTGEDKAVMHIEDKVVEEKQMSKAASIAIFLGALIDGIPESAVIGATAATTGLSSMSLIVAVFLSNFPEGMSSASGMVKNGFSKRFIFSLWGILIVVCGLTSLSSSIMLANSPGWMIAFANAVAAGGILAMLADTMMPEAFELGGAMVAASTIAGFLCTFLLSVY
jgi:CRP-like cAMP-binding protein